MTRWSAQGIAVASWFVAALAVSCGLPDHGSLLLAPTGFAINFLFVCGPVAASVSLATSRPGRA